MPTEEHERGLKIVKTLRETLTNSGWDGARRLGIYDMLADLGRLLGEQPHEPSYRINVYAAEGTFLNANLIPNIDVDNLSVVPLSMMNTTLGQIIDHGHEWGPANEPFVEPLYKLVEAFTDGGYPNLVFSTPDGWVVNVEKRDI